MTQREIARCTWATSEALAHYHDNEWGVPSRDDRHLFEMLNRNARPASTHYHLPSARVMEIGVRIEI